MTIEKIGIAITSFNNKENIENCLNSLRRITGYPLHVELTDDNSADGTVEMVREKYPEVNLTVGSGNLWWAGGTNISIGNCLKNGCSFILLLNADTYIDNQSFDELVKSSKQVYPAIVASLVVNRTNHQQVWWAGSKWNKLNRFVPIWTNRYIFKAGTDVSLLPAELYEISEAHGRGVIIPRCIFDTIGLYNNKKYPHYGADMEFSLRAAKYGYKIFLNSKSIVVLDVTNTGMLRCKRNFNQSLKDYRNYLFKQKNGDALRVWWNITSEYLHFPDSLFTFLFIIALNTFRFWVKK